MQDAPETAAGISHLVALDAPSADTKTALAKRSGPLVRIVDAQNGVDVLQLFEEISCSVNTTAAGGNASLMAMAEV